MFSKNKGIFDYFLVLFINGHLGTYIRTLVILCKLINTRILRANELLRTCRPIDF